MSVNDGPTVTRHFVASSPSMVSTMNELVSGKRKGVFYVLYAVLAAAVFVLTMVRSLRPWMTWGLGAIVAIVVVGPLIWLAYVWLRSRQNVLIDVTGDRLTVNKCPGEAFSLAGAPLGPWPTMGVALHLQSGASRFVLGGRDRRIAPSTRLDAPPVALVDAWLWAAEFDELLGDRGESGPTPTEPTRCLLYPNPYLAEEFGPFAFREHLRHERSLNRPSLYVDIDAAAVRLVDPDGGPLSADALRAQVTATAVTFQPDSVTSGDGSTYDYPALAGLVVGVPGGQRLTIACLDLAGTRFRFGWRGGAHRLNERPDYVVSGGDWLAIVETFGVTPQLEDRADR
jgi:hypothetical protein